MDDDEVLQNTAHREVVRAGDVVLRPQVPWSGSIHRLLRHLEAVGFDGAPRFLGLTDDGRERLSWLEGEAGVVGWSKVVPDAGLASMARLLRRAHDAARHYRPADDEPWGERDGAPGAGEQLLHGDPGPWNVVWRGDDAVALLDWDFAWPGHPCSDVAYALEYAVPFRSDEDALRWHAFTEPPDRRHRMRVFLTAYGLPADDAALDRMVEAVIAEQWRVIALVERLAEAGVQPHRTWLDDGILPSFRERAAWSERHRDRFLAR